jgi:hypothetical protein
MLSIIGCILVTLLLIGTVAFALGLGYVDQRREEYRASQYDPF